MRNGCGSWGWREGCSTPLPWRCRLGASRESFAQEEFLIYCCSGACFSLLRSLLLAASHSLPTGVTAKAVATCGSATPISLQGPTIIQRDKAPVSNTDPTNSRRFLEASGNCYNPAPLRSLKLFPLP